MYYKYKQLDIFKSYLNADTNNGTSLLSPGQGYFLKITTVFQNTLGPEVVFYARTQPYQAYITEFRNLTTQSQEETALLISWEIYESLFVDYFNISVTGKIQHIYFFFYETLRVYKIWWTWKNEKKCCKIYIYFFRKKKFWLQKQSQKWFYKSHKNYPIVCFSLWVLAFVPFMELHTTFPVSIPIWRLFTLKFWLCFSLWVQCDPIPFCGISSNQIPSDRHAAYYWLHIRNNNCIWS